MWAIKEMLKSWKESAPIIEMEALEGVACLNQLPRIGVMSTWCVLTINY